jgi:WD40 repeat protein
MPDNQTTSGKEALFQKTNFKEIISFEHKMWTTPDTFTRVAFSPDSKTVAALDTQNRLWLKDLDTGEQYFLDKQRVFDFQYSPDGKSLAMIDKKGFVRILDTKTWKEIVVFRGHGEVSFWRSGGTDSLSYAPDGKIVGTGGEHKKLALKLWDPLTGVEIMTIDVPAKSGNKNFKSIAFSPDGKLIAAVTGHLGAVNIWDAVNGSHLGMLDSKKGKYIYINIEFSPKGRLLAVNKGTHLELWDVSQCGTDRLSSNSSQIGELLDVFILPSGKQDFGDPRPISFSSDGNIIAVSNGGNVVIWDIAQSREIRRFISTRDYISFFKGVAFSPDGNYLVITPDSGVYLCTVQSLYD